MIFGGMEDLCFHSGYDGQKVLGKKMPPPHIFRGIWYTHQCFLDRLHFGVWFIGAVVFHSILDDYHIKLRGHRQHDCKSDAARDQTMTQYDLS